MACFFTSDHHFGHGNILRHCAKTRPWRDLDEMHEEYVRRWNAVVGADDVVWYLGDFSMSFAVVPQVLSRLAGIKHLVVGNHDRCFDMRASRVQAYLDAGFSSVRRQKVVEVAGLRVVLSHFPYLVAPGEESTDERVAARQLKFAPFSVEGGAHSEVALLHGHIHQHWRARNRPGVPGCGVAAAATRSRGAWQRRLGRLAKLIHRQRPTRFGCRCVLAPEICRQKPYDRWWSVRAR